MSKKTSVVNRLDIGSMASGIDTHPGDVFCGSKVLEGKVFTVTTNDLVAATNENPCFLFHNNSVTKNANIHLMLFGTHVSSNNNIFRVYANPVVTNNGLELTPRSLYVADNQPAAESKCYMNTSGNLVTATYTERMFSFAQGPTGILQIPMYHKLILAPAKKLLVTVRPNTGSVTYSVGMVWVEE